MRSFCLGTELPSLSHGIGEMCVEGPSEDELLKVCSVAEPGEPDCEEVLELEKAVSTPGLD